VRGVPLLRDTDRSGIGALDQMPMDSMQLPAAAAGELRHDHASPVSVGIATGWRFISI
jgi:hypothetical protein